MADTATTQNSTSVAGDQKPTNAGGDKSKTNKIIIGTPFEAGGRADNLVKFIQVDGGPRLVSGWKIHDGSKVEVFGKGLERYNQIALWIGGGRELMSGGAVRRKPGGEGLEFTAKFSTNLYADDLPIEVEFLQENRPDNDRTLEKHFYFVKETEEEKKKRQAREAAEGGEGGTGGRGQDSNLVSEFVNAGLSPLGVMAEAALKSTTDASSVGTKTISQSGTATAGAAVKKTSDETSGGGGSDQIEEYQEGTASRPITSTLDVSTGGQIVSEPGTISTGGQIIGESGTVSTGGQIRTEGGTGSAQTISSGGTVEISRSVGGSGRGVSSATEETPLPTEASSIISGKSSKSSSVTSVGGSVSGTAGISNKVVSGGQTNATQTVTGQSSTIAQGSAGAGGSATEKVKREANLASKTEEKKEVQAKQSVKSKESTSTQASVAGAPPPPPPASAPPMAKSLEATQISLSKGLGGGSGTSGMGSQIFGGTTAPAGLGRMMANKDALAPSGGAAAPAAADKPVQGATSAPAPSSENKNKEADEGTGQPPKKSDQAKPGEPSTSPKEKEGAGLPAQLPGAKKEPAKEAPDNKPPASVLPPAQSRPKPKDDTEVPPPLGPDRRAPAAPGGPQVSQQGRQPSVGNKDKPIDGANGKPKKGLQSPEGSPSVGGNGVPGEEQPQEGSAQPGVPAGPPSAQNRNPRNVFKDPRKSKEENPFAEKNNPAAYPTVRRLLDKKSELAGKGIGQASSKIWYYGFGSSCATFFTGLDFMLGAVVMDSYWLFGHRKNPELFPLKGWQKAVTIAANVVPPILIAIILALIMVARCNWPTPIRTSSGNKYSLTVIGAFIGDDCKYFDVSNITSSGSNATSNTPAASTQTTPQTAAGPFTPLGPSPSTGATPPPLVPLQIRREFYLLLNPGTVRKCIRRWIGEIPTQILIPR